MGPGLARFASEEADRRPSGRDEAQRVACLVRHQAAEDLTEDGDRAFDACAPWIVRGVGPGCEARLVPRFGSEGPAAIGRPQIREDGPEQGGRRIDLERCGKHAGSLPVLAGALALVRVAAVEADMAHRARLGGVPAADTDARRVCGRRVVRRRIEAELHRHRVPGPARAVRIARVVEGPLDAREGAACHPLGDAGRERGPLRAREAERDEVLLEVAPAVAVAIDAEVEVDDLPLADRRAPEKGSDAPAPPLLRGAAVREGRARMDGEQTLAHAEGLGHDEGEAAGIGHEAVLDLDRHAGALLAQHHDELGSRLALGERRLEVDLERPAESGQQQIAGLAEGQAVHADLGPMAVGETDVAEREEDQTEPDQGTDHERDGGPDRPDGALGRGHRRRSWWRAAAPRGQRAPAPRWRGAREGEGIAKKPCDARAMVTALDSLVVAVRDLAGATRDFSSLLGRAPRPAPEPASVGADADEGPVSFALSNTRLELRRVDPRAMPAEEGIALLRLRLAPGAAAPPVEDALRAASVPFELVAAPALPARDAPASGPSEGGVTGLDHVVLTTTDPARAHRLLAERLGIRLALDRSFPERGLRLLFFRLGGVTLEVAVALAPTPAAPSARRDGFHGLAWRVDGLDAFHARLLAAGFALSPIRPGHKPGTRVCTVHAPLHGVPTLLIEHPEAASRSASGPAPDSGARDGRSDLVT